MPKEMPVYVVQVFGADKKLAEQRLVRAKNHASARNHVADAMLVAARATPSQLIELTKAGVNEEQAV